MEKYYIYCRYEFISSEGKKWCKWFRVDKGYDDEESAKSQIEIISSTSKEIDKSTKMKHEYEIRLQDETLIPQIKMRRPKGRPKKFSTDELDKIIKVLSKNGQVKIDDIVDFAKNNNISSIALSDTNMYGTMEFIKKCESNSIKPIIGLEVLLEEFNILLYAKNYEGYKSLIKLSTIQSERRVEVNECNCTAYRA